MFRQSSTLDARILNLSTLTNDLLVLVAIGHSFN